ncbi:MAG: alpha/beta hydrolase [Gemmatimonadota bacterium]|nr:alpha/beta hydrolase [Gemmatimonadota bacterium]
MTRRRLAVSLLAASTIVATSCKLDSIVFSGDAVETYEIPATVIPDSLHSEVQFTSGGETLFGYHLRQPGAATRLGILFSHGKGGNLAQDEEWAHAVVLWRAGFDVLTYDYRGFGKSTGKSEDETTLIADAQAALAFFAARIPGGVARIVSYGHSLGSAPAIALAAANPGMRALIAESGFSNGQAMATSANPLGFPVRWLLREPMMNTAKIATVLMPVLILHGEADIQIPAQQGRDLFAAARDPKQLQVVARAGHKDVQNVLGATTFRSLIRTFTRADTP